MTKRSRKHPHQKRRDSKINSKAIPNLTAERSQLREENLDLQLQLNTMEEKTRTLEKENKEMALQLFTVRSHLKQLTQEIYSPVSEYVGIVPVENPIYAPLICRAESFNSSFPVREFYYVPRDIWDLYVETTTKGVSNLVIGGLPPKNLEHLSSLSCVVTFVSYDGDKIKAPENVTVKTPQQYFKGFCSEDDPIYNKLNLLTHLIDGRVSDVSEEIVKERKLIDERLQILPTLTASSYPEWYSMLDGIRRELRKHGTIENYDIDEPIRKLYRA